MFDQAANWVSRAVGHAVAIPIASAVIAVAWVIAGLDTTNIAISIASVLLLFVLQHSQNRDGLAIQIKLDELIRSSNARNDFIALDLKSEQEIERERE
jgi:low affinity Fe/Cu permease